MHLLDLRGVMFICYAVFINGLILYTYLKMRRAKLYNFYMSKVLLDQAYVDALTEIPNRRSFMAKAQTHLQEDDEQSRYLAMVDIDNFKKVNDQFGHGDGDGLLRRTGEVLKKAVGEQACVARIGGDEFMVLLPGRDERGAATVVEQIEQVVELNNTFYPGVRLSFSIGHATCVQGERLTDSVKVADSRMYEAKRAHYEALGNERRRGN
ncbi:putative diguanylate cyclase DgcQ [compost metagenome]